MRRLVRHLVENARRGILFIVVLAQPVWAGVPVVSDILITDVTDRSFSVVWTASEPSTGSLNVFDGPLCATLTTGILLLSHPALASSSTVRDAIRAAAEDQGIFKVQVSGLAAATPYCVQTITTSKNTVEQTVAPGAPLAVTTETEVSRAQTVPPSQDLRPFSNDIVVSPLYAPDQVTPVTGGLVAVEVVDLGSAPVTAFAGDTVAAPLSLVDLNNLYDNLTRTTMNLLGDERIRLLEYRGTVGCRLERFRKVPADLELAEVKSPGACFDPSDLDCNDTVDVRDIVRDIKGYLTAQGDFCYNSDLDQTLDGLVDIRDIVSVIGKFGTSR